MSFINEVISNRAFYSQNWWMKISALQETDAKYFIFIKFMFCFWTLHIQEDPLLIIFHSGSLWKFKKQYIM
jgi:hypothetical protein